MSWSDPTGRGSSWRSTTGMSSLTAAAEEANVTRNAPTMLDRIRASLPALSPAEQRVGKLVLGGVRYRMFATTSVDYPLGPTLDVLSAATGRSREELTAELGAEAVRIQAQTFTALVEAHKQVIITCDTYPKEISGIENRLISRFGWGLTVAVEPPELEMRVAILLKKADADGLALDENVAFFIAKHIQSNIRELEGALVKLIADETGADLGIEE